jgi:sulfhydrogenase subunit alpha
MIERIGGNARVVLEADGGAVKRVSIETDSSRFFEGSLVGKSCLEAHAFSQRICAACSVSHTLASLKAVEMALGITISDQSKLLRELLQAGAFIQSHAIHLFEEVLPDYGKADALKGRSLRMLGSEICKAVGGRAIHPVSLEVGGFQRYPGKDELISLARQLEKARTDALRAVELFSGLNYPAFKRIAQYASLGSEKSYPIYIGSIIFSSGLESRHADYNRHIAESLLPNSTTKQALFQRRGYFVGARARVNINLDLLSKNSQKAIEKFGIKLPSANPFHNPVAQAIEIVHMIDRSIDIIKEIGPSSEETQEFRLCAGRGVGIVESPKGLLIHDFTMDKSGIIRKANIISPTSQNIRNMEDDLIKLIQRPLPNGEIETTKEIERLIRSYDPCMQCGAH